MTIGIVVPFIQASLPRLLIARVIMIQNRKLPLTRAVESVKEESILVKSEVSGCKSSLKKNNGWILRLSCLLLLTAQSSGAILYMKHFMPKPAFSTTSIVATIEVTKFTVCYLLEYICEFRHSPLPWSPLRSLLFDIHTNSHTFWRLSIPAALYALQNNLNHYALRRLDAVTYQVIQQLKILMAALFTVVLLKKAISLRKWISLTILTTGVILVQLAPVSRSVFLTHTSTASFDSGEKWIGFITLLTSNIISGFAGIYLELLIKGRNNMTSPCAKPELLAVDRSIWIQSMELCAFGFFFSSLPLLADGLSAQRRGLLYGFNNYTYFLILFQALGGALVAITVKYTDGILKAFATAGSIVLSTLVTSILLHSDGFGPDVLFGIAMVCVSVYIYSIPDAPYKNK